MEILRFKEANCKNCFKCLRECSVKAIGFRNGQAEILRDECIICGHCLTVCPQNAKEARNDVDRVKELMRSGRRVVASVAPAFIAAFETAGIEQFETALQTLGFSAAEETSVGAAAVAAEYERLVRAHVSPVLISSSCPTIVKLIERYHPDVLSFLAPVVSPMVAHARMLKAALGPDVAVVFVGPCLSKKDEAGWDADAVDGVLTFEELAQWFEQENVSFDRPADACPPPQSGPGAQTGRPAARLFPTDGGILKSMSDRAPGVCYMTVNGMDNCRAVFRELAGGGNRSFFIEMSACEGSCIKGPCMVMPAGGMLAARRRVEEYAARPRRASLCANVQVNLSRTHGANPVRRELPGERTIREILAKTGKLTPAQELNCGACGYSTCREKAIAVYEGKAEIGMCMPYMRERAEYISDNVIAFIPSAIVVLDNHLNIQAVNPAAAALFHIEDPRELSGRYIGELTDSTVFEEAVVRRENVLNRRLFLYRHRKYVQESVIYVREHNIVFGIIRDTSEEEAQRESLKKMKLDTVKTADNVIEKQMRVVQEIAMLLGETTAETKIALTKLKETLLSEEE